MWQRRSREGSGRNSPHHGIEFPAITCAWEDLTPERVGGSFDAVFSVGNSLTHAPGRKARRAALAAMASALRPDGLLVLTPSVGQGNDRHERLSFWPFTDTDLEEDLRRSGLTPESSTYADDVERYLVTARRPPA